MRFVKSEHSAFVFRAARDLVDIFAARLRADHRGNGFDVLPVTGGFIIRAYKAARPIGYV